MPQFFLSCPKGLEELLAQECQTVLGSELTGLKLEDGGVKLQAEELPFLKLMLTTGIASRGFLQLDQRTIHNLDDLPALAASLPFETWFHWQQTFKVQCIFDREAKYHLRNSLLASQKLKDGIVDRFRDSVGNRPTVDTANPDFTFLIRIEETRNAKKLAPFMATLYMDLCGIPLSHRGWRTPGHEAPLRENVARAMVKWSGFQSTDQYFYDPFCGTGTIAIEALFELLKVPSALLTMNNYVQSKRPENRYASRQHRLWDFLHSRWFEQNEKLNNALQDWIYTQVEVGQKSFEKCPAGFIFASDIDARTYQNTQYLMGKVFNSKAITFFSADALKTLPPKEGSGFIVCNPPFGERLGSLEQAMEIYYQFGENLKANFKNSKAFILANDPELRKAIRLKTFCKKPVRNGDLDCRVLGYDLF